MIKNITSLLFFIISISFLCSFSYAQNKPSELLIHQTVIEGSDLITFLSVKDSDGNLINNLTEENFKINYGQEPGQVFSVNDFSSLRYGTGYLFMVDVSKSVTPENFNLIKSSIKEWIGSLNSGDAASLVSFGEEVIVLQDFTYDRNRLLDAVDRLERTDLQTRLHDGLIRAHNLSSIRDLKMPSRRAVICLTDGINEFIGGASKEEVTKTLTSKRLPIYTIGFTENLNSEEKRKGIEEMAEFARSSGGVFFDANKLSIEGAYKQAKRSIDSTYMLSSACRSCSYDGSFIDLYVSVSVGSVVLDATVPLQLLTSKKNLNVFTKEEAEETFPFDLKQLSIMGVLAITLVLLLVLFFRNRINKRNNILRDNNSALEEEIEEEEFEAAPSLNRNITSLKDSNSPSKINILLTAVSKNLKDKFEIEVERKFIIGRSSKSDLSIKNQPEISGSHCMLDYFNSSLFVSDKGSTNGTYVNGVEIKENHILNNSDVLGLGRAEYRVTFLEEE